MEKRGLQRKKTRLTVRFGADRPDTMGLVTDVSSGGLYITTNAVLPRGTTVRVQVPSPQQGGEPMVLEGHVTRARRVASQLVLLFKGGMGVRLHQPPAAWRTSQALPED